MPPPSPPSLSITSYPPAQRDQVQESTFSNPQTLWQLATWVTLAGGELMGSSEPTGPLTEPAFVRLATFCKRHASEWPTAMDVASWLSRLSVDEPRDLILELCQDLLEAIESQRWVPCTQEPETSSAVQGLRMACLRAIDQAMQRKRHCETAAQAARRRVYQFVYGLTHEINNPLANISARAQRLLKTTLQDSDRKSLATIIDQCDRAHEMLAEVMLVLQPPDLHLQAIRLGPWLERLLEDYRQRARARGIALEVDLGDQDIVLSLCPVAMSEAIGCGLQNAMEACRSGDTVTMRMGIEESGFVRWTISDNGAGVPWKETESLWDLCYSGREAGRGLGIGLAKLERIVEAHGGRCAFRSALHAGSSLEIWIPKNSTGLPNAL